MLDVTLLIEGFGILVKTPPLMPGDKTSSSPVILYSLDHPRLLALVGTLF
jgi:hypothetical protein